MTAFRLALVTLALLLPSTLTAAGPPAGGQVQEQAGAFDLLFDQGQRQFDALEYTEAVQTFDRLITALTAGGQITRPELLVQAYELRARAKFSLGDANGAEQDFASLLAVQPDYRLAAEISPRIVTVFDGVRALTIGQLVISTTPAGEIQIGDRSYQVPAEAVAIDLLAGEHQLVVKRPGYALVERTFPVTAGEATELEIALERVSAAVSITTMPADVEVFIDGTSRGRTPPGSSTSGPSAPLVVADVSLGEHRVELRRECYVPLSLPLTLTDDVQTEAIELQRAVATVRIQATAADAVVFVDGREQGPVTGQPELTICEGTRVIEVRAASGRFVDRREWKRGESMTLEAELRSAFPIVATAGGSGSPAELGERVERALAALPRVLVYAPVDSELQAAMSAHNVPADWLEGRLGGRPGSGPPREAVRDFVTRLASALGAQGIAAVSAGADPYEVSVLLFATGSGEPDVITVNTADTGSQRRVAERVGAELPPVVRPSLDTSIVDVAGVAGAVVIRAGGTAAAAGLSPGDVVTGALGNPVASVAELRAALVNLGSASTASLEVATPAEATRTVDVPVKLVVDTLPLRDPSVLYNRALLELRERAARASTPIEQAATTLNLAVVLYRLGNWDEALAALGKVQLPEGVGVSSGTVAYLRGLALEAAGRATEARTAFTAAAAATDARLSSEGPLVAPLARARLQGR